MNDALDRLDSMDLYFAGWSISFSGQVWRGCAGRTPRRRWPMACIIPTASGAFLYRRGGCRDRVCTVVLRLKSGAGAQLHDQPLSWSTDDEMRKLSLEPPRPAQYFGNPYFAAVAAIEHAIGAQMVDFNKMLSRRAVDAPYVERFGRQGRRCKGSIIVCLYRPRGISVLAAGDFRARSRHADYEFIYVCNSPRHRRAAAERGAALPRIYGLDMTLVLLNANAGFGAANNVAAGMSPAATGSSS